MTTVDQLWFLADEAERRAEELYHDLRERHGACMEPSLTRSVPRPHFRRAVERGKATGAPYGVHTVVYRDGGELLLARHEQVEKWVLPGGEVRPGETPEDAAAREVAEEAGVEVDYDGLAMLMRLSITCDGRRMRGVVPVYAAQARTHEPSVADPDGEVTRAAWFDDLPPDTRDREILREWRREHLG